MGEKGFHNKPRYLRAIPGNPNHQNITDSIRSSVGRGDMTPDLADHLIRNYHQDRIEVIGLHAIQTSVEPIEPVL